MTVDIFLVKDDCSTVANFRCSSKAMEFASKNKAYTVERIEVEMPQFRYHSTVKVEPIVTEEVEEIINDSDKLEDVINAHILNVYNKLGKNKTQTSKAVGITYKTVLKRLKGIGIDNV